MEHHLRGRTLASVLVAALWTVAAPSAIQAQQGSFDISALQTRAEATDFVETSRYDDVMAFVRALDRASDRVHLTTMGFTSEGRAIPLLVVGDVPDGSPEAVMASGKLRVYLQGNIHAGEVPGKEALQMFVRGIVAGEYPDWSDELVLLVVPIYNADGNERIDLGNRPRQNGPIGGMGQRPNAQGYDLNRDHMKLDSPEARSLARMMTLYDPHLAVDLHTTNGSYHAYHITYAPPLHPGTPPGIIDELRGEMLPALTEVIKAKHGIDFYYYGNAGGFGGRGGRGGGGGDATPQWRTFDHRPRFNNNYVGLRNRLAILSEAYAYLTLEERVYATLWFVEEIVAYSHDHARELARVVEAADASVVGRTLPTRATAARSDTMVTILMGEVEQERHPFTGATILRRLDVSRPVRMWEYGTFEATDTEVVPASYLIPPELGDIAERLEAHGVAMITLDQDVSMEVQEFAIDSVTTSPREFQGHAEQTLFGAWRTARRDVPAGTWRVDASQPLGRLAFYLLEPRSDDGFADWGLLARFLEGAETYPILRVPAGG